MSRALHRLPLAALAVLATLALSAPALAQTLTVVGFNVESGAANPQVIAEQIGPLRDIDIWGFSEVRNAGEGQILAGGAADGESGTFESILGTTGDQDRLLIVYNSDRLDLVQNGEIQELNIGGRVRAPLWAQFRVKPSGPEFIFMVNHLYRGNDAGRRAQAQGLNDWARTRTVPVIATGDYNFDWHFQTGDTNHDQGYDLITSGGILQWVRPPAPLVPTNCSFHQSVLDFVFVSGAAQGWHGEGEILFPQPTYCPDTASTSDHRPVLARFDLAGGPGPGPGPGPGSGGIDAKKQEILQKIQTLEQELASLRALVESLDCGGS
ncbi:MAG TPA: endonuclease/exonuclease/phosphatase family protein [Thermoanaerobaculia bacterium]|nr:endonuclease/exonuclease/phosphatase family protein [Thermoanaerobaculia bacterium]